MRDSKVWLFVVVSLTGAGLCLAAVAHFILTIWRNELPWTEDSDVRDHYLAVGDSYTQGFIVGFLLCFCLAVAAVALAKAFEQLRRSRRGSGATVGTLGSEAVAFRD